MAAKMAGAALVLGGGGISGAAWEIGMIAGLHAAGVDLTTANAVIGTSAGAIVGAQILSGVPIDELYSRQFRDPVGEAARHIPISALGRFLMWALVPGEERQVRARIGRAALRARTVPSRSSRASSGPGSMARPGPSETCASPRSTPRAESSWCSRKTVGWTWWTPWPPAARCRWSIHL